MPNYIFGSNLTTICSENTTSLFYLAFDMKTILKTFSSYGNCQIDQSKLDIQP